jgi:predicted transcriptional regulator
MSSFTGYSNEEMDARIRALSRRAGIGGELVVRRVAPTVGAEARASAADAVLEVLSRQPSSTINYIAWAAGLSRMTVANAVAELAAAGRVVSAGTKREATGSRRLWRAA